MLFKKSKPKGGKKCLFVFIWLLFLLVIGSAYSTPIGGDYLYDPDNETCISDIDCEGRLQTISYYKTQKSVVLATDYDNDTSQVFTPGFPVKKWRVFNPSTTTDMYADVDPSTTTTTNYVFIPRSTSYIYSYVEIPVKGNTIRVKQKRTTAVNCRVTAYR